MNIPLYDVCIKAGGVMALSLVETPAIEEDFLALAKQEEIKLMKDQHRIYGPVLIADKPIYRRSNGREYYIRFSAQTIKEIAEKALASGSFNNINIQHNGQFVDGVTLLQLFVIDRENGIDPTPFKGIADGSLMAEFHITNPEIWKEIEDGKLNGFSVECLADLVQIDMSAVSEESLLEEIIALLREINTKFNGHQQID